MALEEQLRNDLKDALRKGDKACVSTLRMLLSAIKYAEKAKGKPQDDTDILAIIAKEVKQRQESIAAFQQGNREDLVEKEKLEIEKLQIYLPPQMSREEIVAAACIVITEVGAKSPQDKGKVMPKIIAELKGKADGRMINDVVTELLSG
ncbi:GatB/YqeY domain-containing protein [Chloroflexota bacterium]